MGIIIRRVKIKAIREGKIKRFDAEGMEGESFIDKEFFQQFGFTSRPRTDVLTEGILIGHGNIRYLICSDDRDNRPVLDNEGDSCQFSNKDNYLLLKIDGNGKLKTVTTFELEAPTVTVTASTKFKMDTPLVELGDGATLRKLIDERLVTWLNALTLPVSGAVAGPVTDPLVLSDVATEKTRAS